MAIVEVGRLNGRAMPAIAGFRVDFIRDWKAAATCWAQAGHGTVFQHARWLEAWYDVFDSALPLIAIISDEISGRQIALVPLICRVHGGIRIVEFADLNITDYNAPILSQGILLDEAQSRALCKTLLVALRRLPERPDLVRLRKMPSDIEGKPNPLVVLGRLGCSSLNGNLIVPGDDFEAYRHSIKRMQLPRSWRVFSRYPGATFRLVTDIGEALKTLDTMDVQQRARMQRLGLTFVLHEEPCARFYRSLVSRGLESGEAVVSTLTCDEATVATVLGVRQGDYFAFLRISNAGTRWSHCSPSRLIIERTMAALHEQGVRQFDLSIGNYAFKRRFGAVQFPLTDASIAFGWPGIPYVLRDRAAQWLRRHPWLASKVGRALGRLSHEE